MKDLIKFCNENVPSSDFERVSLVLLDIFQSLEVEDDWFKSLMEVELVNVDIMTRKIIINVIVKIKQFLIPRHNNNLHIIMCSIHYFEDHRFF